MRRQIAIALSECRTILPDSTGECVSRDALSSRNRLNGGEPKLLYSLRPASADLSSIGVAV